MKENNGNAFNLTIMTSLFFMWGFLTCMNDILIPHMKEGFNLKYWQAMLIQFVFFGAYFIGSLFYFLLSIRSGDPINKIGYRNAIIIGLVMSGCGCLIFYPAAEVNSYMLFLMGLFVIGLGFTLLQIAANPFVSILGSADSASSRLNLTQAFNSLGTTLAPIIGGFLILEYFVHSGSDGSSVKIPYLIFAMTFLVGAVLFFLVKLPEFSNQLWKYCIC